jgi:L-fucose isomerase-like protein
MIKIIPFFSSIFSTKRQKEILSQFFLEENKIVSPEHYFSDDYSDFQIEPHYIFVGTGGTEKDIANFVKQSKLRTPITLLSYDLHNSLPAAMETRSYLEQEEIKARITHGTLTELASTFQRLNEYNEIKEKLRNCRIGVIGEPSEWLMASQIDKNTVEEKWGIKIVSIPIKELLNVQDTSKPKELDEFSDQFINKATDSDVTTEEVIKAGLVFDRLHQLVTQFQLDAVTVECFSLVQVTDITSCYALSLLNDEGIVAGCEGDIPTTFTMLLLFLLVGKPVFMANVIDVNTKLNTIKMAHCTVPTKIIENYSITTHFETGKSVAIRG